MKDKFTTYDIIDAVGAVTNLLSISMGSNMAIDISASTCAASEAEATEIGIKVLNHGWDGFSLLAEGSLDIEELREVMDRATASSLIPVLVDYVGSKIGTTTADLSEIDMGDQHKFTTHDIIDAVDAVASLLSISTQNLLIVDILATDCEASEIGVKVLHNADGILKVFHDPDEVSLLAEGSLDIEELREVMTTASSLIPVLVDYVSDKIDAMTANLDKVNYECYLVFDDWKKDNESIYGTDQGVELSMGDLHSGTMLKATVKVSPDDVETLNEALTKGITPFFYMVPKDK